MKATDAAPPAPGGGGGDQPRALSDIDGFAARVGNFDVSRYHDQQARSALQDAQARWPALARLLGLGSGGVQLPGPEGTEPSGTGPRATD